MRRPRRGAGDWSSTLAMGVSGLTEIPLPSMTDDWGRRDSPSYEYSGIGPKNSRPGGAFCGLTVAMLPPSGQAKSGGVLQSVMYAAVPHTVTGWLSENEPSK